MKLGDVYRTGMIGIRNDGSCVSLPLTIIRKPCDRKTLLKISNQKSIVIASHYKWENFDGSLPKNCHKFFHSFNRNMSWCKIPQASLSESDMVDKSWCGGNKDGKSSDGVLMVTLNHDSGMRTKGFFMSAAIAQACRKNGHKLTILDYGRGGGWSESLDKVREYLKKNDFSIIQGRPDNDQKKMAEIFRSHRLFICPSIYDASPKTITEALCRGVRVLLGDKCIGGNKYINESTGSIFNMPSSSEEMWKDFNNVVDVVSEAINREINIKYDPCKLSNYYHNHWGLARSSFFLASELREIFPGFRAICYGEFKKQMMKILRLNA